MKTEKSQPQLRLNCGMRLLLRFWACQPAVEGDRPTTIYSVRPTGSLTFSRACQVAVLVHCLAGGLFAAEQSKFSDVAHLFPEWTNAATVGGSVTNTPGPLATNAMDSLDEEYSLAIGDRLSFRIIEDEEEFPRTLIVTDSGELEVPYLGRFPSVNKSCKQLACELKAELEKEYYYQATVILAVDQMSRGRGKVLVLGSVRAPGPQEIPRDEVLTVSKAIVNVGGFTDFSDQRNVEVRRKAATPGEKDQTIKVDVKEILEKGNSAKDLMLQPGDVVYVPKRLMRF
jgi:protein involved in polysaccharide export with SLBB domain